MPELERFWFAAGRCPCRGVWRAGIPLLYFNFEKSAGVMNTDSTTAEPFPLAFDGKLVGTSRMDQDAVAHREALAGR